MKIPTPADIPENSTLLVHCAVNDGKRVYTVLFTPEGIPYLWKHGWPRIRRVNWDNWEPVPDPRLTLPAGAGGLEPKP